MSKSTVIRSREELTQFLGLDETDMAAARAEREAYERAWHLTQLGKAQGRAQKQLQPQRISPSLASMTHCSAVGLDSNLDNI